MNDDQALALRALVRTQSIAALGTLHGGEPYVSMVPYAMHAGSADFFVHVSLLAAHTRDMIASPRVSLLVVSTEGDFPQSRARVTIQADAQQMQTGSAEYLTAKTGYIARFPQSADIFQLGDFSMFIIAPVSLRVVGGFAQAFSIGADTFAKLMRDT